MSSAQITLESFSVTAAEDEVGVLMDQAAAAKVHDADVNKRWLRPDSDITISDLDLSALDHAGDRGARHHRPAICDNRIEMKDVATSFPRVYLSGDAVRFERKRVHIASRALRVVAPLPVIVKDVIDEKGIGRASSPSGHLLESIKASPRVLAVGGVQVAGPSNDVWIVENEIEGGSRNGITLGNIIYLDAKGNGDGKLVGLMTAPEDACSTDGSGSIPGTTHIRKTTTRVAAGGRIRNLHILRNRIRDVGMCGIGPGPASLT